MKIAFVHPDLGVGGAERLVVDSCLAMLKAGHEVRVFTSHFDPAHCFPETSQLNISVFGDWIPRSIGNKGHIVFASLRSLYLAIVILLHRYELDVLFVDQISISIPLLRFNGKILFYCHFPDKLLSRRDSLAKRIYRLPFDWLEDTTMRMADMVVVNSAFTLATLERYAPLHTPPEILYPGLRLDKFDQPKTKTIAPDRDIILSINRFERKKDIGLAIQSYALIHKDFPKSLLVLAGGYDTRVQENVEYLQELRTFCKELGLESVVYNNQDLSQVSVVFMLSVSDEEKLQLLLGSKMLVYTPVNEHFGIVPLEAMYCKTPVIATSTGGPVETVINEDTGFLCPAQPKSFSHKMRLLLEDEPLRQRMGESARVHVQSHFSSELFDTQLDNYMRLALQSDNTDAVLVHYVFIATLLLLLAVIPIFF
ncbi:hypothetical protein EDD86DRAFT_204173 [Gorgonomyces haynaldii]|nr:hypothetical protein EDD86DRAFT_204173 [Gorgonomyces haynaldii]